MKEYQKESIKKALSKPVIQLTKTGEFIAEFPSITEAAKITGINKIGISRCLHGFQKTTNSLYIWKFKN